MISHVQSLNITGGTFTNYQNQYVYKGAPYRAVRIVSIVANAPHNTTGLDVLRNVVAHAAFHNSDERFDPPRCHAHTREAILDRILQWARRKVDIDKSIMWINGAAGAGKSAIQQTIAEICESQLAGTILASFFFSRNDGSRNNSKSFVATIVYQIVVATPALRTEVESVLDRDPLMFNKSIGAQITALVIEPIQRLLESGQILPRHFLIIDGLDECMDGTRRQVVDAIWRLTSAFQHGSLFIVSFSSRPEPDITNAFTHSSFSTHLIRVALDVDYRADADVSLLFEDTFSEIRRTRKHIRSTWPSDQQLRTLLAKASGQFIYASTVCKYVASPHHNPVKRLNIALGLCPANGATPFAQLDALYRQILFSVPEECQEEGINVVIMVHILSATTHTVDLALISEILHLDISDIHIHLGNYGALLSVSQIPLPRGDYYGLPYRKSTFHVRPLHASLGDFLFDPSRSGSIYRDPRLLHEFVISRIIHFLSVSWHPEVPAAVRHASQSLDRHIRLSAYSPSLMTHILSIPSETLFHNFWRGGPSRRSVQKVFHALSFIRGELSKVIEYLKFRTSSGEPHVVLEHLYNFCDRLLLRTLAEMPSPDRRLTILLASPSIRGWKIDGRLEDIMEAGSLNIFSHYQPAPQLPFYLSNQQSSHILSFFADPSRSGPYHTLRPSEYRLMTLQCLLYLHEGLFPSAVFNLGPRRRLRRKAGFYTSMFFMRDKFDGLEVRSCHWPSHKSKDIVDESVVGDWTRESTKGVVEGIRCAMVLLCHLLEHTPPSAKILRLVKRPNLKRFPWITSPEYSRKLSKVMCAYRRRFTFNMKVHSSREPNIECELLSKLCIEQ